MEKQNQENHIESVEISTLRERLSKRRNIRLAFTRYLAERYGMKVQTAHTKVRRFIFRPWELVGIEECISRFLPEYTGKPEDFYRNSTMKPKFRRFMSEEMGMCPFVSRRRFTDFDFTELELKGVIRAYEDFVMTLSGKEEVS